MLPLGKAMVIKIGGKHKNTNKTQLLASIYGTNQSLVVYENFLPWNGPSTQLIDATSCVKMLDTTIGAEELAHISSNQTLSADKIGEVNKASTKHFKKLGA